MKKRILSAFVAAVLLMSTMLVAQPIVASASVQFPEVVDGELITWEMTGDTSPWIEIARYGEHSLIIRQQPLTSSLTWYNSKLGNNSYSASLPRQEFNNWYKNKLAKNARLREFAVTNNAMYHWGTYGTDYVDGMSLPMGEPAPTGDDIAFALSYCEAVFYCSTQYLVRQTGTGDAPLKASSKEATSNYNKLLPVYTGANQSPAYWLRTPGQGLQYAGSVGYSGGSPDSLTKGRVNQNTIIGYFGHYRPAMWVNSDIIKGEGTVNVRYLDADDNSALIPQKTEKVPAGPYGPYPPEDIDDYTYIGLAPGSAPPSGTISRNQTLTITHQYVYDPLRVKVTYDPNTGTGMRRDFSGAPGSEHVVSDQGYYKNNYSFDSWNTNQDGSGVRYENGDRITLADDITLYAQWIDDTNFQLVLYDPNGGMGIPQYEITDSQGRTSIKDKEYKKPDYAFLYWNTMPDGSGTTYYVGQNVTLHTFLILYAQWQELESFTVTYHPGIGYGGSVDPEKIYLGDEYVIKSPALVRVDRPDLMYYFTYWTLTADGSGPRYLPDDTIVITSNVTFFANWRME
ncbi:MAG: InlB B-repeat-containing protein [Oscillospiraceae bacterium]|nr:InlB B-repeat-containing protein [Oscillospiraceae bacterium]